jgi:hypothetical protein
MLVVLVVVVSERLLVCATVAGATRHSSERMGDALAVCDIDLFISFSSAGLAGLSPPNLLSLVFCFY